MFNVLNKEVITKETLSDLITSKQWVLFFEAEDKTVQIVLGSEGRSRERIFAFLFDMMLNSYVESVKSKSELTN
jgi:hypothetical protein